MSYEIMVTEIKSKILKSGLVKWKDLEFIQDNDFKEWIDHGDDKLIKSLMKYQFVDPFKVWENNGKIYCLDGKHRTIDLHELSLRGVEVPEELPAIFLDCENIEAAAELVLVYSSAYAQITKTGLLNFTEKYDIQLPKFEAFNLPSFDLLTLSDLFNPEAKEKEEHPNLSDSFVIVPFSILDTRTAQWMQRKKEWLKVGFNSQETREDIELIAKSGQSTSVYELKNKMRIALGREPEWDEIIDKAKEKGLYVFEGASIFDPVLCELAYRWFCNDNARILDPFAGGSVRGIVAGMLGFEYLGIDLRNEQVEANRKQAALLDVDAVEWIAGDSDKVLDELEYQCDFIMSCPPYAYLEKYSNDPDDLSNMKYEDFLVKYRNIISKSVNNLKDNCFACFVVGDIRDKKDGTYKNFVSDTIEAFIDSGMKLYNEMILVNQIGSMAVRLRKQFNSGRKCGKIHQNVLIFYKGDTSKIKENFSELNLEIDLDNIISQPNIAL